MEGDRGRNLRGTRGVPREERYAGPSPKRRGRPRRVFLALACTVLLATLPYTLIDIAAAAKKGSSAQCPPAIALQLGSNNIVTGEPDADGRLRVWSVGDSGYENLWTVECEHYNSVAVGDADGDGSTREILGVTRSTMTEGKGKARTTWYDVHFDAYKEGIAGVWARSPGVREDRVFWMNEITIANVDGDTAQEVVMITYHWLVVYEFESESGFQIHSAVDSLVPGREITMRSLAVANVDGDPAVEILATATDRDTPNLGYLFIFDDADLTSFVTLTVDARMGDQTLRVADLDGDGPPELITIGWREMGELYQPFLLVWKRTATGTWDLIEEALTPPTTQFPWMHAGVGELRSANPGQEIAVSLSVSAPEAIVLYTLREDALFEIDRTVLGDYYVLTINNILVADSDGDGDQEIVASGAGKTDRRSGFFYLEVFDGNLASEFRRLGGERGEREIWHAAVGEGGPGSSEEGPRRSNPA